jgi:biopolymer transport protein ExbD
VRLAQHPDGFMHLALAINVAGSSGNGLKRGSALMAPRPGNPRDAAVRLSSRRCVMSSSPHLAEPALNATPLIDVLLVLLIMLIFTVPIATHAVKLDLPVGRASHRRRRKTGHSVSRRDLWNGQYVASVDELAPKFAAIASQTDSPGAQAPLLQVWADRMAPYERVAQVLAAAQRAKVTKISVNPVSDQ